MILLLTFMLVAALLAAHLAFKRPAHFVIFLLAAGTLRFGADAGELAGGSMDLSALWLMYLMGLCVLSILRSGGLRERLSTPELFYLAFLGWCVFSMLRAESLAFSVRMFLKLLYPFLVMMAARTAIRSTDEGALLLRWTAGAALVSYLLIGGFTQRFFGDVTWTVAPLFWVAAAFADHAALMTLVALVCWWLFGQRRYMVLAALLATSSLFVGIRTGVLATGVGVGAFFLLAYGRRALPLLVIIYLAAIGALLALPELRDKSFGAGAAFNPRDVILRPDQVSMDDINSSGRFAMWDVVMERFFHPDPLMGSGLGSTQAWFYGGGYPGLIVEHSEFVRLLADLGLIGLGLHILALIAVMVTGWRAFYWSDQPTVRALGLLAFSAVPAFWATMGFDNVLNYALAAGQYPFAFAGILVGMLRAVSTGRLPRAMRHNLNSTFQVAAPLRRLPRGESR